jgi:putative flippase GtrA
VDNGRVASDETSAAPPSRLARLGREFGRFAGVGAVAYLVDIGLFNLAVYAWQWDALTSKALSTVVAATVAFIGNRFWTWRHRPRSCLHREYMWYVTFNIVGLGINLLFVVAQQWGAVLWPQLLDNPVALNLVVNGLGVAAASLFRFHSYRTWVFADRDPAPERLRERVG